MKAIRYGNGEARGCSRMAGLLRRLIAVAGILAALSAGTASAATVVKEVTSPGRLRAWLVEDHSVPLYAIHFAFIGGSTLEPEGKEGLANVLASMLLEGAGEDDSAAFKGRLASNGVRLSFTASRDSVIGTMEGLTKRRDEAVALLAAAVNQPRFEADALERVRARGLSDLAFADRHPKSIAVNDWYARSFAGHPYGRRAEGTPESVAGISSEDLERFRRQLFSCASLRVVAVGDLDEPSLAAILDRVFSGLPRELAMPPPRTIRPLPEAGLAVVRRNFPSTVTVFGLASVPASHPDYFATLVMSHIVGSGQFASRLLEAVRTRRGLAYAVSMAPVNDGYASLLMGEVETANDKAAETLDVIRASLARFAEEGPTEKELEDAKRYLVGSFPLGLDANARIAETLLAFRLAGHGPGYVRERQERIAAVGMEDVRRVARAILAPERMVVTVVGSPDPAPADIAR